MKTFVIAVVLLTLGFEPWGAERAAAQGVDSTCLALWQYCTQYNVLVPPGISVDSAAKLNPDSVRIDTCEGTLTYLREYAKRRFGIHFQYYIFSDSVYPDSVVTRQWQEIDSIFPELRKHMQAIEQRFGEFTLQNRYERSLSDTSDDVSKFWYLNFDQYVSVDSALAYLKSLPDLDSVSGSGKTYPWVDLYDGLILETGGGGSSVTREMQQDGHRLVVWPQPCTNEIFVEGAEQIAPPEIMDMLGRSLPLPTQVVNDSTIRIDMRSVPCGILFLKFPEQVIKIIVRK